MKTALTIAGSDSSGGAGVQADIKTMTVHGVYAMSVITALTAQNTMGVSAIEVVRPLFLRQQLEAVFEDIRPDAVKIGMVASAQLVEVIADVLKTYRAENIVLDPVMVATSGAKLIKPRAAKALSEKLFPIATVITPNIPEAEVLTGMKIRREEEVEKAAAKLREQYGCAVLLKGGHHDGDANDFLLAEETGTWLFGERICTKNTHGTGCTLSSAIAANLAKGMPLLESVQKAKAYLSGALAADLDLGRGAGPVNHGFFLHK